jgi:hypothetical protein
VRLESGSNLKVERETQFLKHNAPTASTDRGMQIDLRAEHFANAFDAIRVKFETDSNVTLSMRRQNEKQR